MSTLTISQTIPVARPSLGVEEEKAVLEVLRSGWVSQGRRVAEFEEQFARYVGADHAVAVSSCTTALHLSFVAAGIRSGDEVLCPSLSFVATANSIVHAGAHPVFVDIDISTYNIDPQCIERAITARTKAILVVHQVGLPAALEEINAIARKRGLTVIEDAACAVGAEYRGLRVGSPYSSLACFSFHPRKILTTGEGGMITTANKEVADRLQKLRQHAMTVSDVVRHNSSTVVTESYDEVGYNYRMTDLQAAVGVVQLGRLEQMLERRRELANRYTARLASFPWLVLPSDTPECRHNFQSYMVRLRSEAPIKRDKVMQALLDHGVSSRRGIMAIHREAPYRSGEWEGLLPVTEMVTDTTFILPLYHTMTDDEHDYVVSCLRDAFRLNR